MNLSLNNILSFEFLRKKVESTPTVLYNPYALDLRIQSLLAKMPDPDLTLIIRWNYS